MNYAEERVSSNVSIASRSISAVDYFVCVFGYERLFLAT